MTVSVAARLLALLTEREETLATAESLTGGLIGSLLTDVPGASDAYVGGVISYATSLKAKLAGVDELTLRQWGPVAAPTAAEMAVGVTRRCGADWGLSVTGVAGPGSQDGHPVGRVFVGIARPGTGLLRVEELRLSGSREQIRSQTAEQALLLLIEALGMHSPTPGVDDSGVHASS
ncbi:MAG TPA: CinA family protein [Propionibacteriaceae bacterium]|nr:CinA family protein [Propionibacteriaceae bacterium]